jgi:AraC family transcriptional regulator of adaptative response/methylated-DNA-[protein]-cysteine methyltransferase
MATTARGICCLVFMKGKKEFIIELECRFPGARLFPAEVSWGGPYALHVKGTDFQVSVWRALLEIPSGETRSYDEVSRRVNHPGACRAIGTAIGTNPVSLLIPCHRVIRAGGNIGQYRWGDALKRTILKREGAILGD